MWVCALYRVGGCVAGNLEVDGGVFFAGKAGWREVSGRFNKKAADMDISGCAKWILLLVLNYNLSVYGMFTGS